LKADTMIQDVHFGVVPGCKKPSLWQPGAELLLQMFRCSEGVPEVETLEHSAERIAYRVTVPIIHLPSGETVGHGTGECSTDEAKYKWRKVVCVEEWDATPEPLRRVKWANSKTGPYSAQQIRTEPADLANTILQMAEKRALVNATKTVTAVSDMFAQGLEDMPDGMADGGRPPPKMPQATTQPTPKGDPAMISEPQRKRLFAICQSASVGQPALKAYMENIHSISSTSDIPKGKIYEEICAWAEAGGKVAG